MTDASGGSQNASSPSQKVSMLSGTTTSTGDVTLNSARSAAM